MQGHKSSVSTLPENLSFDHGSTSSEPVLDSQISWNNMQTSPHNPLSNYRIPTNEANLQYHPRVDCQPLNSEWSFGETSSTATHSEGENNERKREHIWPIHSRPVLSLDGLHCQLPNSIDLNSNMRAEFEGPEHDSYQIIDNYSGLPSGSSGHTTGRGENGPGCSVDRISRKRKSIEVHAGQSSGAGSSRPEENGPDGNNGPEQVNPSLGPGSGPLRLNPLSSSARSDGFRRNCRLRINGSRHQGQVPLNPILIRPGSPDDPSFGPPSSVSLRDGFLGLNPPAITENGSIHDQSGLLHATSRNMQLRWDGPSGLRMGSTSGETNPLLLGEFTPQNVPRRISEHPMFVPAIEIGSSSQQPENWNLAGNSITNTVSVGPTSQAGPGLGVVNSSGPSWANRSRPQHSRRLSEIVRRSLLSGRAVRSGPSQGVAIPYGPGNHGPHLSGLRLGSSGRQRVDGAYGLPYMRRSVAAGGEGRTSSMSEIRHVLDLMRRGEGLRFEDVMILDRSVFFGMADIRDHHRDMRLDIDNMSYEELLALGERIGNVCTGLNEETIMSHLKQTKRVNRTKDQAETEPCSICREEYIDGEDLGTLECGHEFHRDCIKQWLMHKNLCPVCKTTGLAK